MRLVYIYSELPSYVRVNKNLSVFSNKFDEVHYIGANRNGIDWVDGYLADNVFCHIFDSRIPNGGFKSIIKSISFSFFASQKLNAIKPDILVLGNEEAYVPFLLSNVTRRDTKIICELLDSLAIRLTGRLTVLTPFARAFSSYVLNVSDRVVEVSEARLSRHKNKENKFSVIHNSPEENFLDSELLSDLLTQRLDGIQDFIYVSGSVVPHISGVESLLAAVEELNDEGYRVSIVYSGRLNGEWANNSFFSSKYVHSLGCLTPSQSLNLAQKSIAMFAFYKPINLNYVYAAPNKVYDAIRIAKPVLMNSECKAKYLLNDFGLLLESSFGNVSQIKKNIVSLLNEGQPTIKEKAEIKERYDKEFSWPIMVKKWNQVLNEVENERK
tara:strand:+ start:16520 stop:17668 length:1149 start_codon:yes stop_codon:yes gene_type:complete